MDWQVFGIIWFSLLTMVTSLNTYSFELHSDQKIGEKIIRCLFIRLSDETTGQTHDFSQRYYPLVREYDFALYGIKFERDLSNYMDHNYEIEVIVNHDWCSFENGGQPRARTGDLKGTNLKRISGREFYYTMTVDIKAVVNITD
uniref:Uncharacterized protein n=1 Tax=Clytia hemisphaerica TaxID=252671 RepID=A0A7M5VFL7_9CNID|eukprot:TCONS_00049570-protein